MLGFSSQAGTPVAACFVVPFFQSPLIPRFLKFPLDFLFADYYKWTHTALAELPILGGELAPLFQELVGGIDGVEKASLVERVCEMLISELKRQGLSDHSGTFLIDHGRCVQETIQDPDVRTLHFMAE